MYSHNVQGLKNEMKEEYLISIMEKMKLDTYIIQEMHFAGDYIKIIGGGGILHDTSQARRTTKIKSKRSYYWKNYQSIGLKEEAK